MQMALFRQCAGVSWRWGKPRNDLAEVVGLLYAPRIEVGAPTSRTCCLVIPRCAFLPDVFRWSDSQHLAKGRSLWWDQICRYRKQTYVADTEVNEFIFRGVSQVKTNFADTVHHGRDVSDGLSRWPLTAEVRVKSQVSTCDGHYIGTSAFPCERHSTNAP